MNLWKIEQNYILWSYMWYGYAEYIKQIAWRKWCVQKTELMRQHWRWSQKEECNIKMNITEMGDKEVNCISLDYNWAKENLMKMMNPKVL